MEIPDPYYFPNSLWDRRRDMWRYADDLDQGFMYRTLLLHPFTNLRYMVSSFKNEYGPLVALQIDVLQFTKEEITYELLHNGTVIIEGKHEEREDEQGFISRSFKAEYNPPDVDQISLDFVYVKLGFDGVLYVAFYKKNRLKAQTAAAYKTDTMEEFLAKHAAKYAQDKEKVLERISISLKNKKKQEKAEALEKLESPKQPHVGYVRQPSMQALRARKITKRQEARLAKKRQASLAEQAAGSSKQQQDQVESPEQEPGSPTEPNVESPEQEPGSPTEQNVESPEQEPGSPTEQNVESSADEAAGSSTQYVESSEEDPRSPTQQIVESPVEQVAGPSTQDRVEQRSEQQAAQYSQKHTIKYLEKWYRRGVTPRPTNTT